MEQEITEVAEIVQEAMKGVELETANQAIGVNRDANSTEISMPICRKRGRNQMSLRFAAAGLCFLCSLLFNFRLAHASQASYGKGWRRVAMAIEKNVNQIVVAPQGSGTAETTLRGPRSKPPS